jgi:hypothetical protein
LGPRVLVTIGLIPSPLEASISLVHVAKRSNKKEHDATRFQGSLVSFPQTQFLSAPRKVRFPIGLPIN